MRIGIISNASSAAVGGPARTVEELAATFTALGHRVDTIRWPRAGRSAPLAAYHFALTVAKLVLWGCDVVHVHNCFVGLAAACGARLLTGCKVCFSLHTSLPTASVDSVTRRPLSNADRYRSFLLRKADALTAVSQFTVDQLREAGWADLNTVTIVPSGTAFKNTFDDQRCYPPEPRNSVLRLLSAGVLAWRWKLDGHIRSLRCLAACQDVLGDFEFSIAGGGPLESELENEVKNLHLETKVRLLGNVTDMRLHFSHADAYLQFVENEGCSLALLEALSHGLPVVGSGKGGSGAILQGLDGVLVLDGTEAEVVEQFRQNAVLSGWLESRTRYARPSLSNYSWDSVCEQYLKVFREC